MNGFQRLAGLEPLPPEGMDEEERGILLMDRLVFEWLVTKEHLVPRRIKTFRLGKLVDLAGISAGYQVNVEHVQIRQTTARYVCRHCGKAAGRSLPSGRCRAYRCEGKVSLEPRDAEHFDVVQ